MSLRLRLQDGQARFTLKRTVAERDGLFERDELELFATPESWSEVRRKLAEAGVRLSAAPDEWTAPIDALAGAGLELTQDRETERRLLLAGRDGRELVELALDTVTYHLGVYEVVFREIEAEALSDETQHVVALGNALQATFPGRLLPSRMGKYRRGLELAARLRELEANKG
jgi:inorganic triphosphatase YgiF